MDVIEGDPVHEQTDAIDIQNVVFGYKSNAKILNKLSLQIPSGDIFALLGPNGCGKTSLIRLILGRLKSTNGVIRVFGATTGGKGANIDGKDVGYMPQNLALFEELTLEEILTFYGKLYHMNRTQIDHRIDRLSKILHLPERQTIVGELSGGQKRLISMAITLIHKPKLVILDEPTVGVDSLLRFKIWIYLKSICRKNGQTVLITTHYIEEANGAANVAFMSTGTVLRQAQPQKLLSDYECETLEAVYFRLVSEKRSQPQMSDTSSECQSLTPESSHITSDGSISLDLRRMKALIHNYYDVYKRRPKFLFIYCIFPIFGLVFLSVCMGQMPDHMPLAVYNGEQDPHLSVLFMDSMDRNSIQLTEYSDNETAFESVVNGINCMSIVFTQNFSESFEARVDDQLRASDEDLDSSQIKVYADFSNPAISLYAIYKLLQTFQTFGKHFDIDLYNYFTPIAVKGLVYGHSDINYSNFMLPGLLLFTTHFFTIVMTSTEMIAEKSTDIYDRLLVSGVKPLEYLIANILKRLPVMTALNIMAIVVSFHILGYQLNGSHFDVFLLLLLHGMYGLVSGLLIHSVVENSQTIMITMMFVVFPLWFISGLFWPIESYPTYVRHISQWTPSTQPVNALRAVISRGWSYDRPTVFYGYAINLFYILLLFALNVLTIV